MRSKMFPKFALALVALCAAALRTAAIERESFDDIAGLPGALIASRKRRDEPTPPVALASLPHVTDGPAAAEPPPAPSADTAPSPSAMLPANTGDAAESEFTAPSGVRI